MNRSLANVSEGVNPIGRWHDALIGSEVIIVKANIQEKLTVYIMG
jgi:hypothetical protein